MNVQVKNLDVTRFLQFCKRHDCEITEDGHVLVKTRKERTEALKYIKQAYESVYGKIPMNLKKSKKCNHSMCVNPSCYYCTTRIEKARFEFLCELSEDVDWYAAEVQGYDEYVKEYNSSIPEFLRITTQDLVQASFMKRK